MIIDQTLDVALNFLLRRSNVRSGYVVGHIMLQRYDNYYISIDTLTNFLKYQYIFAIEERIGEMKWKVKSEMKLKSSNVRSGWIEDTLCNEDIIIALFQKIHSRIP